MEAPPIRLRIDLAYDGTPFHGFARQPRYETVQGSLEAALERLLGQAVPTTCAGRTDRGVHALAQVVHLDVDPSVPRASRVLGSLHDLRNRLDALVGEAMTIWSIRQVPTDFDARFSATERRYRYAISDVPAIDPRDRYRYWHVRDALNIGTMRTGARVLVGEHDFASFCRRSQERHRMRRLDAITVARTSKGVVDVRLRGPAFCHQQVRSIVGSLVLVGRGERPPEWMAQVLAARDRSAAGPVAPAHGLTLEGVGYGRRFPAAPLRVG
ncbi:MAG: tRNA pseudouridine(38-40) synthase TruA [Actinobacteria bacterium]|nr:tRNA pseudouridine(38-40) synthase TruA [Actinomycetota bacterium]